MERNVPKLRFKGFNDEWKEKKLGEFLTFYSTNSFSRDCLNYENGDVQNIHYGDIHMKFPTILDTEKYSIPYINRDINITKYSEESYCKDGDLVIADASEDYADIGKSIEICNIGNKKILAGLHTILARDNKQKTVNGFKGYMMQSESVRKQVKVLAAGAKVLGISKSNLEKVNVKLPTLQEQERIAIFLTKVDKIIEKQEEKVKNLENYKKGMMQKIFSQAIRFKDENGKEYPEWSRKYMKDIGKFTSGMGFSEKYQGKNGLKYMIFKVSDMNLEENTKYMKESNNTVSDEIISEMKATLISENSIIFAKVGAAIYLERKRIVENKFLIDNNMMALTPNKELDINFCYYLFEKLRLSKYAQVGALPSYNASDLANIKIQLPCSEEQKKIGCYLSKIDNLIEKEERKFKELKKLKNGLLQQMFV